MDLLKLLRKGGMDGDVDFLREALRMLVEGIMDAEVSARIGAEYGERGPKLRENATTILSRGRALQVSNAKRYVPVEGEIARTYRPLRQEV